MPEPTKRKRFEIVPGQHKPKALRTGIIFIAVASALLYMGYSNSLPFVPDGGREIKADFPSAPQLQRNAPVRVQGVEVGRVLKVERTPEGDGARVTMRLDDKGVELRRDARAHVYWRTLLSKNMYVALEPGSPASPELGDAILPMSQTTAQTEFDQLVVPLKADARDGIRGFISGFEEAFAGRAPGDAIDVLGPAMSKIGPAMQAFRGTQTGDLQTLVKGTNRALGALAKETEALGGTVDQGAVALGVTAARSSELESFVRSAPAALREIQTTRPALTQTLDGLDPATDALRPGARQLAPAAREATATLRSLDRTLATARPAVTALPPTSRSLQRAAKTGIPLMDKFDPTLDRAKDDLLPWLDEVSPQNGLRNVEAIGPTFSAAASAAQQYDANGHQLRFQPGGGEHAFSFLPCETNFTDPTAKEADQKVACRSLDETLKRLIGGSNAPISPISTLKGRP